MKKAFLVMFLIGLVFSFLASVATKTFGETVALDKNLPVTAVIFERLSITAYGEYVDAWALRDFHKKLAKLGVTSGDISFERRTTLLSRGPMENKLFNYYASGWIILKHRGRVSVSAAAGAINNEVAALTNAIYEVIRMVEGTQ